MRVHSIFISLATFFISSLTRKLLLLKRVQATWKRLVISVVNSNKVRGCRGGGLLRNEKVLNFNLFIIFSVCPSNEIFPQTNRPETTSGKYPSNELTRRSSELRFQFINLIIFGGQLRRPFFSYFYSPIEIKLVLLVPNFIMDLLYLLLSHSILSLIQFDRAENYMVVV